MDSIRANCKSRADQGPRRGTPPGPAPAAANQAEGDQRAPGAESPAGGAGWASCARLGRRGGGAGSGWGDARAQATGSTVPSGGRAAHRPGRPEPERCPRHCLREAQSERLLQVFTAAGPPAPTGGPGLSSGRARGRLYPGTASGLPSPRPRGVAKPGQGLQLPGGDPAGVGPGVSAPRGWRGSCPTLPSPGREVPVHPVRRR